MHTTTSHSKQVNVADMHIELESGQFLTFSLGQELFAVGILVIKEIIQYGQITAVPLMPSYVVPVIDLHARFGRGAAEIGKRTCIVILEVTHEGESHDIGIMVDAVSAVIDIPANQIEPAPTFGSSVRTDFIEGIGKVNDQFVIILDVARTFSMDELAMLEGMSG